MKRFKIDCRTYDLHEMRLYSDLSVVHNGFRTKRTKGLNFNKFSACFIIGNDP